MPDMVSFWRRRESGTPRIGITRPRALGGAVVQNLIRTRTREALRHRFAAIHESLARGHDERIAEALAPYLDSRREAGAPAARFAACLENKRRTLGTPREPKQVLGHCRR